VLLGLMSAADGIFLFEGVVHYQMFPPLNFPLIEDGAMAPVAHVVAMTRRNP